MLKKSTRRKSPYQAIKQHCFECSGWSYSERNLCRVFDCPLWEWRHGVHPETAKVKFPELMDPNTVSLLGDLRTCRELLDDCGPEARSSSFFQETVVKAADHPNPVVSEKLAAIVASKLPVSESDGDLCSGDVPVGT